VKAGVDAARIDNLSAELALQDLQIKFPDHTDPLHLRQLAVQLEARRGASAAATADAPPGSAGDRIELNAHALSFTTGDGVEWPASSSENAF
jgi:hypothetical protein